MDTPSLRVDLDAFDANVETAERLASEHGKLLRPHVKTHRTPALALRQLTASTSGVTCATVGEAEAMVAAGISDVLIANELTTAAKIARVAALARDAAVTVAVDAPEPARALAQAAADQGVVVAVLVDVDVGLGRCGVVGAAEAVELAREVDALEALELAGLMGYEGRLRADADDRSGRSERALAGLAEVKAALEGAGMAVRVVSGGGTSTLRESLADPATTEIQAGTYALMEDDLHGLDLPFRFAASVAAAVISRRDDRAVVDAGRKTLGCDYGPPIPVEPGQRVVSLSEEQVVLAFDGEPPALGAIVRLRPSHVRTTFNLYDFVWLERAGQPPEPEPVSARGASR